MRGECLWLLVCLAELVDLRAAARGTERDVHVEEVVGDGPLGEDVVLVAAGGVFARAVADAQRRGAVVVLRLEDLTGLVVEAKRPRE